MENKTVLAVIGCGRIVRNAHLPALSQMADVRIKYACDTVEDRAKQLQADFPIIENIATDYRTALADPEVDAVFVITPNHLHHTITMAALQAGKHVFC